MSCVEEGEERVFDFWSFDRKIYIITRFAKTKKKYQEKYQLDQVFQLEKEF